MLKNGIGTVLNSSWSIQPIKGSLTSSLSEPASQAHPNLPLPTNKPIVHVKKELYKKHTQKGVAVLIGTCYIGPNLERREMHCTMASSDTPEAPIVRYSCDNGRTWLRFQTLTPIVTWKDGAKITCRCGPQVYDPASQLTVSIWLRRTIKDGLYYDHSFYRTSHNYGKTWGKMTQICYEPGPAFDVNNPLDQNFLERNQIYHGSNLIRHLSGTLIFAGAGIRIPQDAPDPNPDRKSMHKSMPPDTRNIGSACFSGRWNSQGNCYQWQKSNCVWVPRAVSTRGLREPHVAELNNGNLLVIWRGRDSEITPGRKWFSVSKDAGLTLSEVRQLKYDDGSEFYSPSSIHRMIRSTLTGKLYWVGNICPTPPNGNRPRYPLDIFLGL